MRDQGNRCEIRDFLASPEHVGTWISPCMPTLRAEAALLGKLSKSELETIGDAAITYLSHV